MEESRRLTTPEMCLACARGRRAEIPWGSRFVSLLLLRVRSLIVLVKLRLNGPLKLLAVGSMACTLRLEDDGSTRAATCLDWNIAEPFLYADSWFLHRSCHDPHHRFGHAANVCSTPTQHGLSENTVGAHRANIIRKSVFAGRPNSSPTRFATDW